jgi:hypothetical protein
MFKNLQEKETRYIREGNIMKIEIPSRTPEGRVIKTIGIWSSGGADSSLLMYLLCKDIKERKLNIKIQPYTVRRSRPCNPINAANVIDKIEELLDFEMNEHIIYYPSLDDPEYCDGQVFTDTTKVNFKCGNIELLYSGITKNPPVKVQEEFRSGVNKEEYKRGENTERPTEHHDKTKNFEWWQINPFIDINKKDLAEIYKREGLLDTLYPVTYSCEHLTILSRHCGNECWWCEERMWAFGRLI